ncbi:uncharacterized protein N7503_005084 [Penicillium pulvis]|uniref:uncharacterized protein n=1 Tax=Penicillium pulvis TaxID=1562058 RepID=UPI0025494EA4|nr:uncharacterized protein N7503_005084 [Penicillium pulvis]KAJ5802634.1 hypothetical protein N7503_005084 [Penicillium pulvis]
MPLLGLLLLSTGLELALIPTSCPVSVIAKGRRVFYRLEGSKDGVQTRALIELLDGPSCGRVYIAEFRLLIGLKKKWKTLLLMIQ